MAEQGRPLKTYLTIKGSKKGALLQRLSVEVPDQRSVRGRGSKQKDYERLQLTLFANALYGTLFDEPVHYARQNDEWNKKKCKLAAWLPSGGPGGLIDRWQAAGLLECKLGFRSSAATEESEFKAAPKLVHIAKELGITLGCVEEVATERPNLKVRVRTGNKLKKAVFYDPQEEPYRTMNAEVGCYNAFIAGHKLKVIRNGVTHELPCNSLYQVFNSEDLSLNGRFFGASYQQIRSEIRPSILIDDIATVELDFSACFGRMLYHLEGINYPSDPYAVDLALQLLQERGATYKESRSAIKFIFQVVINSRHRGNALTCILNDEDTKGSVTLSSDDVLNLLDYINFHHPQIKHHFYNDIGVKLMNYESTIAKMIMFSGLDEGIAVLCIHDSFIVQSQHKEWLRSKMIESYNHSLSFSPIIK